jgi:hypothetical protein
MRALSVSSGRPSRRSYALQADSADVERETAQVVDVLRQLDVLPNDRAAFDIGTCGD